MNTDEDNDYDYYIACDIEYRDISKEKTEHLALMPLKRTLNDNELG